MSRRVNSTHDELPAYVAKTSAELKQILTTLKVPGRSSANTVDAMLRLLEVEAPGFRVVYTGPSASRQPSTASPTLKATPSVTSSLVYQLNRMQLATQDTATSSAAARPVARAASAGTGTVFVARNASDLKLLIGQCARIPADEGRGAKTIAQMLALLGKYRVAVDYDGKAAASIRRTMQV